MIVYDVTGTSISNFNEHVHPNVTFSNISLNNITCFEIPCLAFYPSIYDVLTFTNVSLVSSKAIFDSFFYVGSCAQLFVDNISAFSLLLNSGTDYAYNRYCVFAYDRTNFTLSGDVAYVNTTATSLLSCGNVENLLFFNASLLSGADTLFSPYENCTVVVEGVPFYLINFPYNYQPIRTKVPWIVFAVCCSFVTLVVISAYSTYNTLISKRQYDRIADKNINK